MSWRRGRRLITPTGRASPAATPVARSTSSTWSASPRVPSWSPPWISATVPRFGAQSAWHVIPFRRPGSAGRTAFGRQARRSGLKSPSGRERLGAQADLPGRPATPCAGRTWQGPRIQRGSPRRCQAALRRARPNRRARAHARREQFPANFLPTAMPSVHCFNNAGQLSTTLIDVRAAR